MKLQSSQVHNRIAALPLPACAWQPHELKKTMWQIPGWHEFCAYVSKLKLSKRSVANLFCGVAFCSKYTVTGVL